MSSGGYDISSSVSRTDSLGSRTGDGDFIVGGGGTASWVWPVALGALGLVVLFFFLKKK